jgi:hypothetical protein
VHVVPAEQSAVGFVATTAWAGLWIEIEEMRTRQVRRDFTVFVFMTQE